MYCWNLAVLLLLFIAGNAAPTCWITAQPTAADIRSEIYYPLPVLVSGGTLIAVSPAFVATLNTAIASTSGHIRVFSVVSVLDVSPPYLQLQLEIVPEYVVYANDTVVLPIAGGAFGEGVGCTLTFTVTPSPGIVLNDLIPSSISEVDVNTAGSQLTVPLKFDDFTSLNISVSPMPLPEGLSFEFALDGPGTLLITVAKNATFNIPRGGDLTVQLTIPATMMRSGLTPIIGNGAFGLTALPLVFSGSTPFVSVTYGKGREGARSEDIWDGTAVINVDLFAETWDLNVTSPRDVVAYNIVPPTQPYGFAYYLGNGLRPGITISSRRLTMTFPALEGFALSSGGVQTVELARLTDLMSTKEPGCTTSSCSTPCICSTLRILQANPYNVEVQWGGSAFSDMLSEADIRKQGLHILTSLRYDVFTSNVNIPRVKSMFFVNQHLSLNELKFTIVAPNRLNITIPAQPTYNIDRRDVINMTLVASMIATQALPPSSQDGFVIHALTTPSICTLDVSTFLTEDLVRERDNLAFGISLTGDSFCPTTESLLTLANAIYTSTGQLSFYVARVGAREVWIGVNRSTSYDTSHTDIITVPMPYQLFCNLESCLPKDPAVPPTPPNALSVPVRRTMGRLLATLGEYAEDRLRVSAVAVKLALGGDTFALPFFKPLVIINSSDPLRGFNASIRAGCGATRSATNISEATWFCPANASYDISAVETVTIVVTAAQVDGGVAPDTSAVTPMKISPLRGRVTALFEDVLEEREVVDGGYTAHFTLLYERWNVAAVPEAVRNSLKILQGPSPRGMDSSTVGVEVFSPAAFTYNRNEDEMTWTIPPSPSFDIVVPQIFLLLFSSVTVTSGVEPLSNSYQFTIVNSTPITEFSGTAVHTTSREVIDTPLTLFIRLRYDLWQPTATFDVGAMCPLGPCTTVVSDDRRILTILYEANTDYLIAFNTTYIIPIVPAYTVSGLVPKPIPELFVAVSSGVLSWTGPTVVTEDLIRDGIAPSFTVLVRGDLFRDVDTVREAIARSMTCEGSVSEFSTCARASALLRGVRFELLPGDRTIVFSLQADELFDVFEQQRVTFRIDGSAMASRVAPLGTMQMTVAPVPGRYFLTGIPAVVSERDMAGYSSTTLRVVISLIGERWLANASRAMMALWPNITTNGGIAESLGLSRYRQQLFPARSALVTSQGRILSIVLYPVQSYSVLVGEDVTIAVGGGACVSGLTPSLASPRNSFRVTAAGGLVDLRPTVVLASDLRTVGANLSVLMRLDQWRSDVVQRASIIVAAFIPQSPPSVEPHGFAVNRAVLLAEIAQRGAVINGTSLILRIQPAPGLQLLDMEQVVFQFGVNFTLSGFSPSPTSVTLSIVPEYIFIETTVFVNTTQGPFDADKWTTSAALVLGRPVADIVVSSIGPEPNLPQTNYQRVSFRIASGDPIVPFDNRAAALFLSLGSQVWWERLRAVAAFSRASPPSAEFWRGLQPNPPALPTPTFFPIHGDILWAFVGVVVAGVVVVAAILYRRGLATRNGHQRATVRERDTKGGETVEEIDDLELYAGQQHELVSLRSGDKASTLKAFEVPLMMYAGQASSPPRVKENPVAPVLVIPAEYSEEAPSVYPRHAEERRFVPRTQFDSI